MGYSGWCRRYSGSDKKLNEDGTYGDCTEFIETLSFRGDFHSWMDGYDICGDYDNMTDMEGFFYWVAKTITEIYTDCSMDAHYEFL